MRVRDTMGRAFALGAGIVYGAAMMYLLDPDMGRRRRMRIRDQLMGARNDVRRRFERQMRNALQQLQGSMAEVRAQMRERKVPDEILKERVRAQLGHVVSHPGSVEVLCHEGRVMLRGPVRAGERTRIEQRLRRTRGVREYALELEEQESAGPEAGLAGNSRFERKERIG